MDTSVLEITATDQLRGIYTTLQRSHIILPVREPNVSGGTTPMPAAGPEHPTLPLKRDLGAGPTSCLMAAHVHGQDTHSQSRSWIHIQTLKLGMIPDPPGTSVLLKVYFPLSTMVLFF